MKSTQLKSLPKILLIALITLAGCVKEDINSPLVGEWTGISFTTSVPVDVNQDGVANTDLMQEMNCVSMEAKFTGSGNFSIISTDETYDISFVDGKVVLTPTGCGSYTEIGNWSLNDASTQLSLEFTIAGKDEPTIVDVQIDLTDQILVMKDLFYDDDSLLITYSVEFRKQ